MFFRKCRDARMYAKMESIRTHYNHIVKPCKKYLCPPKKYFGQDYINGFTVVLEK
jgi:hypothetical protein